MVHDFVLLFLAILAALGSPGPVVLSLAGAGAIYGAGRNRRYLAGILLALAIVISLSAMGVSTLLAQGGIILYLAIAVSISYLAYLAYKIATAPIVSANQSAALSPPTARDGLILGLTNPKAYAVISAIFAGFTLPVEPKVVGMVMTGISIFLVATLIDIAWLLGGQFLMPIFGSPKWGRRVRIGFAITMVLSVLIGFSSFL